jgi:hypothetical protein
MVRSAKLRSPKSTDPGACQLIDQLSIVLGDFGSRLPYGSLQIAPTRLRADPGRDTIWTTVHIRWDNI